MHVSRGLRVDVNADCMMPTKEKVNQGLEDADVLVHEDRKRETSDRLPNIEI